MHGVGKGTRMGVFLSATAIKTNSAGAVAAAVIEYFGDYGVNYTKVSNDAFLKGKEVAIYQSTSEWVVVIWPSYFGVNELPAVKYLSKSLDTLISSVSIYDGESWSHSLYRSGSEIDLYNSTFRLPFQMSPSFRFVSWGVNIQAVSTEFNVNKKDIACYFRKDPPIRSQLNDGGCNVSKETANSPWVFTDFWKKVGVKYPIPDIDPFVVYGVDARYTNKLP